MGSSGLEVSCETIARSAAKSLERVEADERLDAAVGRADRRLADEVDHADLGTRAPRGCPRRARATTGRRCRPRARRRRTSRRRAPSRPSAFASSSGIIARDDLEVVADRVVGDLLDLAAGLGRERLAPAEVEAQVAGLVERAGLVRARAEHLAQRRVHEVRAGVRLRRAAAVVVVDDASSRARRRRPRPT